MPKKGFLGDIKDSTPISRARSPFKNDDPTVSVRIAQPLYDELRKIAFNKHKRVSKIASVVVSYGLPIFEDKIKKSHETRDKSHDTRDVKHVSRNK